MFKKPSQALIKLSFFTFLILLIETLFFHILNYIYGYFEATLIIAYTIFGIGIGAFWASRIKCDLKDLFRYSLIGTSLSLYIAILKLIFLPSNIFLNFVFILIFLFPAIYITKAYELYAGNKAYFYDMLGGFIGILSIVLLFQFTGTEEIFILVLLVIALTLLVNLFLKGAEKNKIIIIFYVLLFASSVFLFKNQIYFDKYNLFNIINCEGTQLNAEKSFCKYRGKLIKSYDSLVGRIDVTKSSDDSSHKVSYNGYSNDHFNEKTYATNNPDWPLRDIRVLYGVVPDPKIFVVGASAQGIIKPLKQITPPENITAIEINPGIIKMMRADFYEESGKAYQGINPIVGNGLAYLAADKSQYDIITLINLHTYRNLPYSGPPDYVHTKEGYELLLSRLTDKGYILLEERPETKKGQLGFYRELLTIMQALKNQGATNPADHLAIWSWNWGDDDEPKYWHKYYISMIVSREPIQGEIMDKVIKWIEFRKNTGSQKLHLEFLNNYYASPEFKNFFAMVNKNDFSSLSEENFVSTYANFQKPFLSQTTNHNTQLGKYLFNISLLAIFFGSLLIVSQIRKKNNSKLTILNLNLYYILIGFAFFFIEIIIFETYQNIFTSPANSLIFTIGLLLLFSGLGGHVLKNQKLTNVIMLLTPICLITINFPKWFMIFSMPPTLVKIIGVGLICLTGFLLGAFFPRGFRIARELKCAQNIPYLFAINALAGSIAIVGSLYLAIWIGHLYTAIIALLIYLFVALKFREK